MDGVDLQVLETALARLTFDLASAANPSMAVMAVQAAQRSVLLAPLKKTFAVLDALRQRSDLGIEVRGTSSVEIPRRVLPVVSEFLVESVRNWEAHGYQGRAERKFASKSQECQVTLLVRLSDHGVVLEFHDDGPGLVPSQLLKRVREIGTLSESERARLAQIEASGDEAAFYSVLFADGVSTRSEATLGAGRGMGLARLSHLVAAFSGRVWAERSRLLGGFCLSMELPLELLGAWVDEGRSPGLCRVSDGEGTGDSSTSSWKVFHRLPAEARHWSAESFSGNVVHWVSLEVSGAVPAGPARPLGLAFVGLDLDSAAI